MEHWSAYLNQRESQTGTGYELLDFMFTVALSIGIAPELLQKEGITGIVSSDWLRHSTGPSGLDYVQMATVGLGLFTLIFSWHGYRASVSAQAIKWDSWLGLTRFTLDILLVILYGLMMIQFRNLAQVMWILTAVFLIYGIWDILKMSEAWLERYKDVGRARLIREFIWWPVFIASGILAATTPSDVNDFLRSWMTLVGAYVLLIAPRIVKIKMPRPTGPILLVD